MSLDQDTRTVSSALAGFRDELADDLVAKARSVRSHQRHPVVGLNSPAMTTNTERTHTWLATLTSGAVQDWDTLVAAGFSMHAPLMPGEPEAPTVGRDTNRNRVEALWRCWRTFEFTDVDVHAAADDPELVFVTARSEAETVWGSPYRNRYIIRLRFDDGVLTEHLEFMDPRPVLQAFEGHL